jgi:serpin B
MDLYNGLRSGTGNLALSPLSISMALTMTWYGARGETAEQLKKVLHAAEPPDTILDADAKLLASLADPAQKVTVRVANRLFGEKGFAFEQPYLDRTKAAFGAPLEPLDFKHAPEPSRAHINDWVGKATEGHITNLLPSAAVNADTRLVLVDAIYFLGDWDNPFKAEATKPLPFSVPGHAARPSTKNVPTMSQEESFRFAHVDNVKVLEMPYQGSRLAMTVVLPDATLGLAAVEARLSGAALGGWVSSLALAKVKVELPRFKIQPASPMNLGAQLTRLGMPIAFTRQADFTGIAHPPQPEDRLFLGAVMHQAFVKVDEKGTEAAAATAVSMRRAMAVLREPPPQEFKADHPFLFFLRDVDSGAVLFMGRVIDPS